MQQQGSQAEEQESHRHLAGRASLLETVVSAASVVNKVLTENCGLCTVYCDQQVNYENWVQQQYHVSTLSMNHLFEKMNPNIYFEHEVKQYQDYLFDEQSVLESVASRDTDKN
jgi:aldehyde:ferredoxin oxidoreductase